MAKTKQGGKTRQSSPRPGKRRGVKMYGGQKIKTGQIIVRQKGTKFFPGQGTKMGRDFTIFATRSGSVKFSKREGKSVIFVL